MELFSLVHDRLSLTVMLFMAAVGVWGIVAYLRGQSISGSFAGALAIGEALVLVQVAAGASLLVVGVRLPVGGGARPQERGEPREQP